MLCCIQSGRTALYWAAYHGDVDVFQMLIDHGAVMDLSRNTVTNHDYLLTFGWNFGCGFIVIHASINFTFYHNIIPSSCIVVVVHVEKGRQYVYNVDASITEMNLMESETDSRT
jgi:ankyrin repeat protein